jgi:long-chain acyl-CoA synthetase
MKSQDALLTAWEATLARKGDGPAIFDTRGGVLRTFREIEVRSGELDRSLGDFGAGDVVAIQIGNHEDWPSWLITLLRRGIVTLPLEPGMGEQERTSALKICNAAAVVAAAGVVAAAVSGGRTGQLLPMRTSAATTWRDISPSLLKLTSGTTATPRAIRFRSDQLLADCNQICETMGISDNDINFAVIPLSHSYGFSNLITPLIARGVPVVLSSDAMPHAILDDLEQTGATIFPGMPVFYQAFCELEKVPALNRLRLCISAGAPLSLEVARKFCEKFGRSIHSFYGASECGGICYDREGYAIEDGFVGEPMNGIRLELLDPDAESSQVCVKSDAVGDGYFPQPDEEKLGPGFFIPDDLLHQGNKGFRVVGRVSDLINVAGKKVNPAEVEAELLRCAGVKQAVVFGRESALRNEEVVACVVGSPDLSETKLLESCRQRLSGWQVPKQIFFVSVIPVNERGKISRRELARRFAPLKFIS